MSSALSAEQLGHVTMFIEDRDGLLTQLRAMLGDEVSRLPGLCVHFAPVKLAGDAVTGELDVEGGADESLVHYAKDGVAQSLSADARVGTR